MSDAIYAAKIPLRTAYLKLASRFSKPSNFVAMLRRYGIDVVLDVGANNGQYARRLLSGGFQGGVVSFEPLPSAFEKLKLNSSWMSRWSISPLALGDKDSIETLNVAGNSQSSSMLPMADRWTEAGKNLAYVDRVRVQQKRLDSVFDDFCQPSDRVFLKMDVQGLEHQVLEGASGCLERIAGIQMEVSTKPLYGRRASVGRLDTFRRITGIRFGRRQRRVL